MSLQRFLVDAAITAVVTFMVATIVTYFYNLLAHGSGWVDWGTAIELAIVFGIVLPLMLNRQAAG